MSIISYYMCRSLDIMLVKVAQTSASRLRLRTGLLSFATKTASCKFLNTNDTVSMARTCKYVEIIKTFH
jgi:hypothetical protein